MIMVLMKMMIGYWCCCYSYRIPPHHSEWYSLWYHHPGCRLQRTLHHVVDDVGQTTAVAAAILETHIDRQTYTGIQTDAVTKVYSNRSFARDDDRCDFTKSTIRFSCNLAQIGRLSTSDGKFHEIFSAWKFHWNFHIDIFQKFHCVKFC